jgi:methanogenic corrinoid protein MtbC1
MDEFKKESGAYFELSKMYLETLLRVQRDAASRMIIKSVEQGTDVKDIYLYVFEPSQHEVGRLWQKNQINVAQEHFCTAATQMIMSQLYPYIFRSEKSGHKLVATCVTGELHEIGVRMIADIFEMEGWDTYYLGANTPNESILETVKDIKPDILAISASINFNVNNMAELIKYLREQPINVKILIGGRPFTISPDLWKKMGADGCATNALDALNIATNLIKEKKGGK